MVASAAPGLRRPARKITARKDTAQNIAAQNIAARGIAAGEIAAKEIADVPAPAAKHRPFPSASAVATAEPPPPGRTLTAWLGVVLVVILMAGGLFGYDQGVISGALHGIQATFSLDALLVEVVTSWVTLGALLGALAGGELADRIGRQHAGLAAGLLFRAGAAVQALAPDAAVLVAGRLVVGLGVGVAAVAAPLYGAEIAPSALRGRFVAAYQLAITIGIFLAYLVDGLLAQGDAWRLMLGLSAVPGLLLVLAALAAPESPRWLMKMHRRDDAAAELARLRPGVDATPRLDSMAAALRQEDRHVSWREMLHRDMRRPLTIAIGLAIFQQVTGINAIIYYADQIFAAAGFTSQAAQTAATTWAIGAVNVGATLIAIAFIDRLGRRKLLLAGLIGMGACLAIVGGAFQFIAPAGDVTGSTTPSGAGIATLVALVGFIICFAFSLGPVVWTVINEIFPGRIRGRAVAVATAINWGAAFLVSQCFLSLVGAIGDTATFWMFAMFCGIGWVWIYFSVPETKGRSLEQIEQFWQEP
jgi:SP family galactose:H+ symporter-like MFS transporter